MRRDGRCEAKKQTKKRRGFHRLGSKVGSKKGTARLEIVNACKFVINTLFPPDDPELPCKATDRRGGPAAGDRETCDVGDYWILPAANFPSPCSEAQREGGLGFG